MSGLFCWGHVSTCFKNEEVKNDHRKIDPADLNSPRRELSNGGLGIVVALLVRWQIVFLSAYTGGPIQLYSEMTIFTFFNLNCYIVTPS